MKLLLTALFVLLILLTGCATEIDFAEEEHGLMSCPLPEGSIRSYPIANGGGGYVYVNIWYEHCEAGGWDGTVRLKWVRVIHPDGTVAESDIYIEDCRTCGIPMSE
jgi:hypothetical protein